MTIHITTPSVTINNTSNCDLGAVMTELKSLHSKINQVMALIDDVKQKLAEAKQDVATLQTSLDNEQAQIAELLATNAQVVTDLNTQIATLTEQLANSANPTQLQEIIDGITEIKNSITTTKTDLEGTIQP